jgi:uncharacterized repeat protein (TIGR01451 family)
MSKMFFKMGLGLLAVAGLVWPAAAALPGMTALHGHVPAVVSQLAATGRLAATNRLSLAIGLPLHNQAGLDALLQQINDPTSPSYHHFLTSSEFTTQFGPTEAEYQQVIRFAQTNGLIVKHTHANRMLVEVDGRVSDIEHTFNITLHTYRDPKANRQFFAPDVEPSVPAAVPVLDVSGLDNYVVAHPRFHYSPKTSAKKFGSGSGGTYFGNDFRAAYVPGTTLTGAGQKVALFEYDGYLASDIALYEQKAGYAPVSLTNILLQGFSGFPFDPNSQVEVTLDIEMAIAMAPGLNQVLVYEGNPNASTPNNILNQIAADNAASLVSCSWGWSGGPSATTDQIFQEMVLQGQCFFDASGDVCAFLPPGSAGSVDDPTLPNAPSDNPYIVQVGATTLTTSAPGGSRVSETVWNWGNEFPGQGYDGVGSSGGISGYYAIPSWQQGISMAANHGSTAFRNLPDVALTGDNVDVIVNGTETSVGGTSCAAPLWAGFAALVNQQAILLGKKSLGFLNPSLYALAKTGSYASYFNDVTNGDNTWSQSPTNFYAVAGYDLATGLGTPNGTSLINALASSGSIAGPVISAPLPPWGNTLSVMNGGNPNGAWFLFVQDDKLADTGIISNGWSVALTTESPVGYAADNQVYATPASVTLTANTAWPVTLAVTNYGPSASTNVYVTDTLPVPGTGVTLASSTATAGSVSITGDTLTWTVGNLAVNAGAGLTLNFYANSAAFGLYTNTAQVNATTTDPNPDDNTSAATLLISGSATPPQLTAGYTTGTGAFHLSVTGVTGQSAIIQASTNLVSWFPVYTNVIPFNFTNFDSTNYLMRFYRVVVGP